MRTRFRLISALLTVTALAAAPLAAQNVTFSGHGVVKNNSGPLPAGAFSFSFVLPQSPVPDADTVSAFALFNRTGSVTQAGMTSPVTGTFDFYTSGACGGFDFYTGSTDVVDVCGPQLFTGVVGAPTFTPGTFTGFTLSDSTLTTIGITDVTIASTTTTPEPSSMALLGTGLIGLVPMARRKLKK